MRRCFWMTHSPSWARRIRLPTSTLSAATRLLTTSKRASKQLARRPCRAPTSLPSRLVTVFQWLLRGPRWQVLLGRRDSWTAAGQFEAGANLPPAGMDVPALIGIFASKGLDAKDMVALSGAHTIGETRCGTYRSRIYTDNNVDPKFAAIRKNNCPPVGGDNNWTPLDLQTPTRFDNKYYRNLLGGRGILHSDQALYSGGPVDSLVKLYSANN
ncbi:hypothetical protein B296_00055456, partial [Ensete ventricosum]